MFIVVLSWFLIFAFIPLPSVMMFTPLLILLIPRLQKREVVAISIIQLLDDFLFYVQRREQFIGIWNILSFLLTGRTNILNYDEFFIVMSTSMLLTVYVLNYLFVKLLRLKKRIGRK